MSKRSLTILVVEDNVVNQFLLRKILERNGHTVCVALNGKEAVDANKNNDYDLILMDLMMPVMSGFDATVEIRQTIKKNVPIVAVTSNVLDGEKERCFSIGMNGFLSKPVSNDQLETEFAKVGLKF
ncbi:MAG: response regulator [Bacteroidales bacterium]|nr:response regulator [Bacteroidales bacterium]MCF8456921.1 response regulator [Bacteroidales bacterium]